MSGVRAVLSFSTQPRVIAGLLACALACGGARAADASPPAPADVAASAPAAAAEATPLVAAVPVPGSTQTVDIPAPLATVSAPTVPVPDSVIGGDKIERVQVTDPFIELHTFPGRGYPIFFVAARGEWIAIELRHTDWYKVRTAGGKEGWVTRAQLQTTLAESGLEHNFGDVAFNDYLARRVELGAGYGRFHQEPMIKFWLSYRLSDTLSIESTLGQVQGVFSGTTLWHVNLQAEPWSDERFSPFAGIGIGQFKNIPNQSLVNFQTTNARLSDAIIGARYHLTDRFMIRVDYAVYTAFVSEQRSLEYRAATAGLSFFF
jgi:uncharacterized protein YgiM (DUF1202 family)